MIMQWYEKTDVLLEELHLHDGLNTEDRMCSQCFLPIPIVDRLVRCTTCMGSGVMCSTCIVRVHEHDLFHLAEVCAQYLFDYICVTLA